MSAFELLAHRVVWTAIVTLAAMAAVGRLPELRAAVRDRRGLVAAVASSALISGNGLAFFWAVANDRVLETSLGYYLTPLVNVVLGYVVLREPLTRLQGIAVTLAAVGVVNLTVGVGSLPWVSLVLAGCFGLYGLVRKVAPVESLAGLCVEMSLAAPFALLFLGLAPETPLGVMATGTTGDRLLLAVSGVATAAPLWLFAIGARRLRYTTMGLLMYVTPTGHLALAVLAYGEPFTASHAVTFALIWAAVIAYAGEAARVTRLPPAP